MFQTSKLHFISNWIDPALTTTTKCLNQEFVAMAAGMDNFSDVEEECPTTDKLKIRKELQNSFLWIDVVTNT